MKKTLILCLLFLSFSSFAQNFTNLNYIQVVGNAEEEITPNEIYIQIVINEQDNKGKESVESMESKMIKKLKELNINIDSDLSIVDLSSNFQKYLLKQTDIFTSKEYQLILHNSQTVVQTIMALEKLGISNINIVLTDHSDLEKYKEDARKKAILNAQQKAKTMAEALEQNIGKAMYIHEYEVFSGRLQTTAMRGINIKRESFSEAYDSPNIEFEKIKVEAKVEVYFELK